MGRGAIATAAQWIRESRYLTAFTGAGISVESGIPSFRGQDGIWNRYDPRVLEISYFRQHPEQCWKVIREIFYDQFLEAEPNEAHYFLADLERQGLLRYLITQNIDELHHRAGSRAVAEYHGNTRTLICTKTGQRVPANAVDLSDLPPLSPQGGVYKPDFVFFGETIPAEAAQSSQTAAQSCDTMIVIGSTGEVFPAAALPGIAKKFGARIIEINPLPSAFTAAISDLHIELNAVAACQALRDALDLPRGFPGMENLGTSEV